MYAVVDTTAMTVFGNGGSRRKIFTGRERAFGPHVCNEGGEGAMA